MSWTVREDLELAAPVRGYVREEHGRPEQVRPYQRSWWIPHPDWEAGQQRWVTAGEAAYERGGAAARAKDKTADAAEDAGGGRLGEPGREPHGYEPPDPARLVNERARTHKTPGDHPFFQRNPMSAKNIVAAYDDSNPAERYQGMRWYADAHRLAWALGGGDAELGAKVLSAYSPRAGWPLNMFNAARSLAEGKALGPGDGIMMAQHQKAAQAAMDGADIDTALPSPKTNAFARLMALGEDHPEDPLGAVVIDRHALSVAAGRRLTKADTEGKGEFSSPIGKDPFYSHVADEYRKAALELSQREGTEIAPHQVQAITWLRQQRLNTAADLADTSAGRKRAAAGLVTAMRNHWEQWQSWAEQHGIRTELGTTAIGPVPITEAEARGNSQPQDAGEWHQVASRGRELLHGMEGDRSAPSGLTQNWDSLRSSAWSKVQESWGGMTIDAHTGEALPDGADKFALSVKPPGTETISIPEGGTEVEFDRAMDQALQRFGPLLEQGNHYLGIFHDDENHRIDIDPVVVVDTQDDAEAIGAYTHNIGGAYRFSDGNGYFPPHIKGQK